MTQALIIILFVLAIISCSTQFSLFLKKRMLWVWFVILSLYVYIMHSWAIEQSYSVFQKTLSNSSLITDFVVLQIIEAIMGLLISIYLIRFYFKERIKAIYRYSVYFPGIVLFPAIFYIESYLFLKFTGLNFQWLAVCLAIIIPALLLIIKWMITKLIPDFGLRLELKFGLHIIQLIAAIILSVILLRLPVRAMKIAVSINQILILTIASLLLVAIGMLWYNFRMKRLLNNYKNG